MQHARGFIVGCATGWLRSPGRQSTPNSKLGKLFIDKKTILSSYYIRVTKWLVTCLQSNPIGTNFAGYMFTKQSYWHKLLGLWFKLEAILLVQTARAFLLGAGNPTISRETETQVPAACQSQPRQPRIIKLISQLQKPTIKISDTWIIDTGKRETRYRLVKIHQTILQPHSKSPQ